MTLVNWNERDRDFRHSITKLTNEQLADSFCKCLIASAESYRRAALLMREAEERGVDFRPIARNLHSILLKIAHDQVLPEVIVFCGTKDKLRLMVERLPIPDQVKLLETEAIPLAEGDTERMIDPRMAESWQLRQLFSEDRIRSVPEQRQWVRNQESKSKRRQTITLASRSDDGPSEDMTVSLQVRVTPEEAAIVEGMAKENGWPKWYAVRRFLRNKG